VSRLEEAKRFVAGEKVCGSCKGLWQVEGRKKADLGRFGAAILVLCNDWKELCFWRERVMTLEFRVYK